MPVWAVIANQAMVEVRPTPQPPGGSTMGGRDIDFTRFYTDDPEPDMERDASLVVAAHAHDRDDLLTLLDMLGLPPCKRRMRTFKREHYGRTGARR